MEEVPRITTLIERGDRYDVIGEDGSFLFSVFEEGKESLTKAIPNLEVVQPLVTNGFVGPSLRLLCQENLEAGTIVSVNSSGLATVAMAGSDLEPIGVLLNDTMGEAEVATTHGAVVPVKFGLNYGDGANIPQAWQLGSRVYLSDINDGMATMEAPTASGSAVYAIGVLVDANGHDPKCSVLWSPSTWGRNA